jgi:hypothetical protein
MKLFSLLIFEIVSIAIVSVVSFKIQHIKTRCWTYSCYDTHYNNIFIEMNKNPDYLHHNTIMYYNSLYTTIVYK